MASALALHTELHGECVHWGAIMGCCLSLGVILGCCNVWPPTFDPFFSFRVITCAGKVTWAKKCSSSTQAKSKLSADQMTPLFLLLSRKVRNSSRYPPIKCL